MRVYSSKAFAGLTILSIVVGVVIAQFAYLGLDMLYPYASTSGGRKSGAGDFTTSYGELTFTAFAVSPTDVKLNLLLVNYFNVSYYDLTVWIENLNISRRPGLFGGFELVSGNLSWYGSAATQEVKLEVTIRAVKNGVWSLDGVAAWYYGGGQSQGSGILEIVVSDGRVTDIRRPVPKFITPEPGQQMIALNISADLVLQHDLVLANNNVTRFCNMSVLVHGNVRLIGNATLILDNARLYALAGRVFLSGTSTLIALRSMVDANGITAEDQSNLFISNTRLCMLSLGGSAQLNLSNSSAGPSNLYDYSEATIFNSTIGLDVSGSSTVRIYNCNSTQGLSATETSTVEIFNSTIGEIYLRGYANLTMFSSKEEAAYLYWTYYRGTPLWNGSVYFNWRLTVKVVDYIGSPIPNAEVKITRVDGDATEQIFNGTTNSEGIAETYLLEKIVKGGKILMGGNQTIAREEEILNNYNIEAMHNGDSASTNIQIDNDTHIQLKV